MYIEGLIEVQHYQMDEDGMEGVQLKYKYLNNYGASVVRHSFSYGGKAGLWELAVLDYTVEPNGEMCYHTPITQDVIGYLDEEKASNLLKEIQAL